MVVEQQAQAVILGQLADLGFEHIAHHYGIELAEEPTNEEDQ